MEIRQGTRTWYNPNVKPLAFGQWTEDRVIVNPLLLDVNVPIPGILLPHIEENWVNYTRKNPRAFPGPTVRYCGYHILNSGLLVVDVVYSDYRISQTLGWLGAAMVPVTSDGFVAIQAPVNVIEVNLGKGIRVPGCTPADINFFQQVRHEMKEEFGVAVERKNLSVLGLVEIIPPTASHHYGLIFKVKLSETIDKLRASWMGAEDRWEGELLSLALTKERIAEAIFGENIAESSKPSLFLVAESEFGKMDLEIVI